MVILMNVWDVINCRVKPWRRLAAIGEEITLSLAVLPLLGQDMRQVLSTLVTASDASETGGGVCAARKISDMGRDRIGVGVRSALGSRCNGLCLMESFGGMSGARRALEILGVTPALHLHWDTDEGAVRVAKTNYPDMVSLGDVTKCTEASLRSIVRNAPHITHVLHCTGPPCQQVSGLNPTGAGVKGKRSGLMTWVPVLRTVFRRAFPDCKHGDLCEMVASLTADNQKHYDKMNQGRPVRICPSDFSWVRRPRLYWISWPLQQQHNVEVVQTARWTSLRLKAKRMPLSRWVKRGWKCFADYPTLPTFVRATIRKKPPFMPAGIKTLRRHELQRYARHQFIYPPYQFQDKHLLWDPKRNLVPPTAEMREILMGYERDYTHAVWSAGARRANPLGFELARCSLLGNTFHAGVVAWLLGHLLTSWGILSRPPLVSEVADPCRPAGFGHRAALSGQDW